MNAGGIALVSLILVGCSAVGPTYDQPQLDLPGSWIDTAEHEIVGAPANASRWWTHFKDPLLTSLVEQALGANLDLRVAYTRIQEARAAQWSARSGYAPTVDLKSGYTRSKASANSTGLDSPDRDTFNAGLAAKWEVDLFGRIRRSVQAARADYQASVADREGIQVSLAAEVAGAYVDIRAYQQRLGIAQSNIETQEKSLALTRERFQEGAVSALDPAQAESVLASTQAEVPNIRAGLTSAYHRLSLLLGQAPGLLDPQLKVAGPIPGATEEILIGVPADLLRRRPDIRSAERSLAAQSARIGVAAADLYPTLGISGQLGYETRTADELFGSAGKFFGIGPAIRWNLFDGGAIRANISIQRVRTSRAALEYESTVLSALREVEDALAVYRNEKVRRTALDRARAAGRRATTLSLERYTSGDSDFQQVLDAQRSQFDFEDKLAASEGKVTQGLIAIYKAIGGGWDAPEGTTAR